MWVWRVGGLVLSLCGVVINFQSRSQKCIVWQGDQLQGRILSKIKANINLNFTTGIH